MECITSKCAILYSMFTVILVSTSTRLSQAEPLLSHLSLQPGSDPNAGMLQVLNGKFWGHVCYNNWTPENAIVACRHLGYSGVDSTTAMAAKNDRMAIRGVYLQNVVCNGSEANLWECSNTDVGMYTDMCDPLHVVWLSCYNEVNETPDVTTVSDTIFFEPPPPVVGRVTSHSVSLDWTGWYDAAKINILEDNVIYFKIMFRPYEIANNNNFTMGTYVPSYTGYGTVQDLSERTVYEFKIDVIQLAYESPKHERVGLVSPSIITTTTCVGPKPVRRVSVDPGFAHQLTVSWDLFVDEDCPPENIVVEYKVITIEQCKHITTRTLTGTVRTRDLSSPLVLDNLHPYSTYIVNITVENDFGRSLENSTTVTTPEDVPNGTPINITTEYHSSQDSLMTMWKEPHCGQRHGRIAGYTYMLLDVQTDHVIHSGSTQLNIQHLLNVDRLRKYKFLVAARTNAGMGPYGAASVVGQPNIAEICGETNTIATRIAGGSQSTQGDFPWIAQLWLVNEGKKYCTGSILDEYWILTAAHCINTRNITRNDIRIQVGDYDSLLPEPQQRVYNVAQIESHVGFNIEMFEDDIALIRVTEPIEFSDYIKPICLPDKKLARSLLKPIPGRFGTVSGWGKQGEQVRAPRYLKTIILPIVERPVCKKATNYSFTPNMFCAGFKEAGLGDICDGDSGAPFMVNRERKTFVTGIVSWANNGLCDQAENNYGYYTRIFKYMSWIKKIHPKVVIYKSRFKSSKMRVL